MRLARNPDKAEAEGFVLAGGLSSRMGSDKALVQFQNQPLIERALGILRAAGLRASIAGTRSPLAHYASVVMDGGHGPLGGVCAALASASGRAVAFLSVDMPLIPPALVMLMLDYERITDAPVTIASVNGYSQTFPAIVQRAALQTLESELQKSNRGCFAAFQSAADQMGKPMAILPVELLAQPGQVAHEDGLHPSLWFLNLNRTADVARAELIAAAHHRVS